MKLILLTITFVFSLFQTTEALEITFKQNVSIDESVIKLGDVADFDENTDMAKALATKPVGQAPPPGDKISLRSIKIKQYFAATLSLPEDTRWTGSPTVTVHRRSIKIGPKRIQTIISDFIQNNKNFLPDADIRFIPNSLPLPFTLPTGDLSYEVIPSSPAIINSSRFSIIFRVNNKVVKNMSVRGKVEAFANVVVSSRPLKKGQIIDPQMVSFALQDISKLADPGLDLKAFIGKRLKRTLRAGSPILSSMVEALPIVKRGERVKIVINSGQLHLTATGLAHSDGKQDQMIRVENISSNKIIYCRVAAAGIVEVML